jgi:hypothetical protein
MSTPMAPPIPLDIGHSGTSHSSPRRFVMNKTNKNQDAKVEKSSGKPLTDDQLKGIVGGAEAYCVKDKKKVEVLNPQRITMKNGKPA